MVMKYIVMTDEDGKEELIIFSTNIYHDAMAESLEGIKNQTHGNWERIFRRPISAGFITTTVSGIYCYGDSETLNLHCRTKEDNALLKIHLGI